MSAIQSESNVILFRSGQSDLPFSACKSKGVERIYWWRKSKNPNQIHWWYHSWNRFSRQRNSHFHFWSCKSRLLFVLGITTPHSFSKFLNLFFFFICFFFFRFFIQTQHNKVFTNLQPKTQSSTYTFPLCFVIYVHFTSPFHIQNWHSPNLRLTRCLFLSVKRHPSRIQWNNLRLWSNGCRKELHNVWSRFIWTQSQRSLSWIFYWWLWTILQVFFRFHNLTFFLFLGIIPRACAHIFDYINNDETGTEFTIKCSFLGMIHVSFICIFRRYWYFLHGTEIYKEVIHDLLNPKNTNLRVRETPSRGVWVENLSEVVISFCCSIRSK